MGAMLAPLRGKHANQGTALKSPRPPVSWNSTNEIIRNPAAITIAGAPQPCR
jgi:hypothetical protein